MANVEIEIKVVAISLPGGEVGVFITAPEQAKGDWGIPTEPYVDSSVSPLDQAARMCEDHNLSATVIRDVSTYQDPATKKLTMVYLAGFHQDWPAPTGGAVVAFGEQRIRATVDSESLTAICIAWHESTFGITGSVELAARAMPGSFTMRELRSFYEGMWDRQLDSSNFRRRFMPLLTDEGLDVTQRGKSRPAQLYSFLEPTMLIRPLYDEPTSPDWVSEHLGVEVGVSGRPKSPSK